MPGLSGDEGPASPTRQTQPDRCTEARCQVATGAADTRPGAGTLSPSGLKAAANDSLLIYKVELFSSPENNKVNTPKGARPTGAKTDSGCTGERGQGRGPPARDWSRSAPARVPAETTALGGLKRVPDSS